MQNFSIPKMACGGCAKAVTSAISALDPEASVQVDLETRSVSVRSRGDSGAIIAALKEAGYEATPQGLDGANTGLDVEPQLGGWDYKR